MTTIPPPPSGPPSHYAGDLEPKVANGHHKAPSPKVNPRAYLHAGAWALASWACIGLVFWLFEVTDGAGTAFGRALIPAAVAFAVAAAWARASKKEWLWWRYPAVIDPVSIVLAVLLVL